jgi:hypothetical protein
MLLTSHYSLYTPPIKHSVSDVNPTTEKQTVLSAMSVRLQDTYTPRIRFTGEDPDKSHKRRRKDLEEGNTGSFFTQGSCTKGALKRTRRETNLVAMLKAAIASEEPSPESYAHPPCQDLQPSS